MVYVFTFFQKGIWKTLKVEDLKRISTTPTDALFYKNSCTIMRPLFMTNPKEIPIHKTTLWQNNTIGQANALLKECPFGPSPFKELVSCFLNQFNLLAWNQFFAALNWVKQPSDQTMWQFGRIPIPFKLSQWGLMQCGTSTFSSEMESK